MSAVMLNRPTSRVMHLGVWALHYPLTPTGTGRFVPICGQDRGNRWEPFGGVYGWVGCPEGKRVCTRCLDAVDRLALLGASG